MVWKATLAVLALMVITGCDSAENVTHADIEAAVAANQQAANNDLDSRIEALEREISNLRDIQNRQSTLLGAMTKADVSDIKYSDEAFDRLFKNDETIRTNVNWLLAREGARPIPRVD